MTDVVGNPEEERRAEFYYQPWAQEAVCRYFYSKVNCSDTSSNFWVWSSPSAAVLAAWFYPTDPPWTSQRTAANYRTCIYVPRGRVLNVRPHWNDQNQHGADWHCVAQTCCKPGREYTCVKNKRLSNSRIFRRDTESRGVKLRLLTVNVISSQLAPQPD